MKKLILFCSAILIAVVTIGTLVEFKWNRILYLSSSVYEYTLQQFDLMPVTEAPTIQTPEK